MHVCDEKWIEMSQTCKIKCVQGKSFLTGSCLLLCSQNPNKVQFGSEDFSLTGYLAYSATDRVQVSLKLWQRTTLVSLSETCDTNHECQKICS